MSIRAMSLRSIAVTTRMLLAVQALMLALPFGMPALHAEETAAAATIMDAIDAQFDGRDDIEWDPREVDLVTGTDSESYVNLVGERNAPVFISSRIGLSQRAEVSEYFFKRGVLVLVEDRTYVYPHDAQGTVVSYDLLRSTCVSHTRRYYQDTKLVGARSKAAHADRAGADDHPFVAFIQRHWAAATINVASWIKTGTFTE
jgi:hypothetical protein